MSASDDELIRAVDAATWALTEALSAALEADLEITVEVIDLIQAGRSRPTPVVRASVGRKQAVTSSQ